ncbi:MAG: PD40 domain-containing protein [Gemmatimonadetes bacterium]|nr:PD40 domain-containing protein [Gemmatimonadota bacterium]
MAQKTVLVSDGCLPVAQSVQHVRKGLVPRDERFRGGRLKGRACRTVSADALHSGPSTDLSFSAFSPSWSPDGKKIAFGHTAKKEGTATGTRSTSST